MMSLDLPELRTLELGFAEGASLAVQLPDWGRRPKPRSELNMSKKCRMNTSAPAFVGFRASAGMASGSTVGVGVGALLDDDAVGVGVGIWGSGSSALQPATRRSGTAQVAARVRRTDTNKPVWQATREDREHPPARPCRRRDGRQPPVGAGGGPRQRESATRLRPPLTT